MAMDKEMLFAYFQEHYLSRQEVLFKLPLNYSIDSFWPELLNRRKTMASVLPLYNASGMPYWYVLTKRMIAASERLCGEAIAQDGSFDPYRAEMTSAMTEEMFFTSFVEGAQFPLQEAMDFLARGTEPESIHEQIIWNNRHAWSEMVGGIYRPLDEQFVKALAYMLTEEMDGCAEDYRQTDSHPIAAMNNEPYEIPPAYLIPERMGQYYGFLRQPDIHPLIKSSVAQAYLLVARPFPEGNERLSRMMSAAVLLRCGYDFFRDISISSVIARENYRYYKAMCDIIRPENGGDMTYFMEYYLELLVRALDDRRERLKRRQQDALEIERQMAAEPLAQTAHPPDGTDPSAALLRPDEEESISSDDGDEDYVTGEHIPMDLFLSSIEKLKHSPNSRARETRLAVQNMLNSGLYTFTVQQWADHTKQTRNNADYQCRYLFQKGFLDKDKRGQVMTYTFRVIRSERDTPDGQSSDNEEGPAESAEENPSQSDPLLSWIISCEMAPESYKRNAAAFLRELIAERKDCFTTKDLIDRAGLTNMQAKHFRDQMVYHRLVVNTSPEARPSVLRMLLPDANGLAEFETEPKPTPIQRPAVSRSQAEIRNSLNSMLQSKSETFRIAAETIQSMAGSGRFTFMRRDWAALTGLPHAKACDTCDVMLKRGIISNDRPGEHVALYRINLETAGDDLLQKPEADVRPVVTTDAPSEKERRISLFLAQKTAKGQRRFTSGEWGDQFGLGQSGYNNDLRKAVAMGLITKVGMTPDRFAIYEINQSPENGIKASGMTKRQKELLSVLYAAFESRQFSVHDCAEAMGQAESGVSYYLKLYVDRGIMAFKRFVSKPGLYSITVTPATHPDCFLPKPLSTAHGTWTNSTPVAAAGISEHQAVI